MTCESSKQSYEAGKSDGTFDGIDSYYQLPHLCTECRREYLAGFSDAQDELLGIQRKTQAELQEMWFNQA